MYRTLPIQDKWNKSETAVVNIRSLLMVDTFADTGCHIICQGEKFTTQIPILASFSPNFHCHQCGNLLEMPGMNLTFGSQFLPVVVLYQFSLYCPSKNYGGMAIGSTLHLNIYKLSVTIVCILTLSSQ